MNLMNNPALVEQLAASYALGTLRGGVRRRFEALARQNPAIRAAALIWQGRMGSLVELQAEAAPGPAVWKRIENLVQADMQAKELRARRAAPAPVQSSGWWASLGLWRGVALAGTAAAAVAVFSSVNLGQMNNDLQSQVAQLRQQGEQLSTQTGQLQARLAATPEIQYVSVLADDKSNAAMLVTFDPKNNRLLLKRVGGFQEQPDKSLQLWALPPSGGPQSLGVLGRDAVLQLASNGAAVREAPTLAISLEPIGGAPAGSGPTGPVLFKGTVIEAPR
jgi:anti-sigma-K factor RskA